MGRIITFSNALKEALSEEMARDERVYLIGQDLKYNVWGVTNGLNQKFGDGRVLHAPISENGFVSSALGSALVGSRPVVELMYSDFLLLAADAVADEAAKYRYMNGGGAFRVPMTIRAAGCGVGSGSGAHHAQDLEATFIHFPGLKIVIPSTPYDAKGLLKTAIRREGADVTIVSWGYPLKKSLEAAELLQKEGIEAEVLDPRTLVPFDKEALRASLSKTGRLVVVEDGVKRGGVGGEIAGIAAEEMLDCLDAPVRRLGAVDAPLPAGRYGEKMMGPSVEEIVGAVKEIV